MLVKVLIKISGKTPLLLSLLNLGWRQGIGHFLGWNSEFLHSLFLQVEPKNPQLLFVAPISQHAVPWLPYIAVGFVFFLKYEPKHPLALHHLNYVFTRINNPGQRSQKSESWFLAGVTFLAQYLLDALTSIRLLTIPLFLCFVFYFCDFGMISPVVVESVLAQTIT